MRDSNSFEILVELVMLKASQLYYEEQGHTKVQARTQAYIDRKQHPMEWKEQKLYCAKIIEALIRLGFLKGV